MLPGVEEASAKAPAWLWAGRLRELLEGASKSRGRGDLLNPALFDGVMKTCKWLGFGKIEVFFGNKKGQDGSPTVFQGRDRFIPFDLDMLVMGMRA
jgi:hypothetical protein